MPKSVQETTSVLKSLNLSIFVKEHQSLAERAESEGWNHTQYLHELACQEQDYRQQRRVDRLLQMAKLPHDKHLQEFEISRIPNLSSSLVKRLSEGSFIDQCHNVIAFGNPGTGKTHLSIALAREWCLKGRRVLYQTTANLVQDLLVAKRDLKLKDLIKKLDKYEMLIIDDISYIPFDRSETDVLFTLLSDRYERRSLMITSNLPFSGWKQIFKDDMTTAAAIDRLVHHSVILELNAPSFRVANSTSKKKNLTPSEKTKTKSV